MTLNLPPANFHTVFSAECNPIFDWHSVALFHSHKKSGQRGGITRLLACSAEQLKTYQGLDIGPTFVHHNHRGDEKMNYAAFNKPASVNYWVHSGAVPEGVEFVMQLDADMLIHRPVDPAEYGLGPGVVLSAPYDYLVGTHTGLPDVFGVKNKHLQARVGGVHVFHIDDLRRIAPLWLNFTERVRDFACREPGRYYELASPSADRNDHSEAGKGRRRQFMWMVEMYGYVFGAAEAGVQKHVKTHMLMRYTGDVREEPGPHIIHYGIDWQVRWHDADRFERSYDFNKLLYLALDVASCPRWFMPLAPFASGARTKGADNKSHRDTLCGKQIAHFNEAICEYYQRHCMTSVVCPPPDAEEARIMIAQRPGSVCVDLTQNCLSWARKGECSSNPGFMTTECAQSCGLCTKEFHRPYLGLPPATCFDEAEEAKCISLAGLGACRTQIAYMQESCRKTCEFCNASKDAFADGSDHGKGDTAQHQCPDGSDLGGGEVLVISKGAESNAALASEDDLPPPPSPTAATAAAAVEAVAATPTPAAADVAVKEAAPRQYGDHEVPPPHSWPFSLMQCILLIGGGYLLRGFLDRQRRRKGGKLAPSRAL